MVLLNAAITELTVFIFVPEQQGCRTCVPESTCEAPLGQVAQCMDVGVGATAPFAREIFIST